MTVQSTPVAAVPLRIAGAVQRKTLLLVIADLTNEPIHMVATVGRKAKTFLNRELMVAIGNSIFINEGRRLTGFLEFYNKGRRHKIFKNCWSETRFEQAACRQTFKICPAEHWQAHNSLSSMLPSALSTAVFSLTGL